MARTKTNRSDMIFIVIFVFLIGFISGVTFAPQNQIQYSQPDIHEERVVSIPLPAVDNEGNGVIGTLYTTVKPGTGKILLDTSKVLNYPDTQLSGRTAAKAAGNYAKINLSGIDIIYTIKVNASIIEGPSAGSSMAISVLLAINNRTVDGIAMTGTINPDGTIGNVGAVLEKARMAKLNGARLFLVPKGQSTTDETSRQKVCSMTGSVEVCKINYESQKIDIGAYLNMTVREVGNIGETYAYFTDNATF